VRTSAKSVQIKYGPLNYIFWSDGVFRKPTRVLREQLRSFWLIT